MSIAGGRIVLLLIARYILNQNLGPQYILHLADSGSHMFYRGLAKGCRQQIVKKLAIMSGKTGVLRHEVRHQLVYQPLQLLQVIHIERADATEIETNSVKTQRVVFAQLPLGT
jgi:hypothetical protein